MHSQDSNSEPDVVKNLLESFKLIAQDPRSTPDDMLNARREICQACNYWNSQRNKCMKCGCLLAAKLRFRASRCPIGKW